jgi:hypothetical protein
MNSKVTTIKVCPRQFDAQDLARAIAKAVELICGREITGNAHYNIAHDNYDIALEWDEEEGESSRATW